MAEVEKILLVYIGSRINTDDKLDEFWLEVTPEQFKSGEVPEAKYRSYEGKATRTHMAGSPGNVYEVEQKPGTSTITPATARYQGRWPNAKMVMQWQVDHRTDTTTIALRKKAKKDGADDNFSVLIPFKAKYRKLISQYQRAAMLAQMIAYITGR